MLKKPALRLIAAFAVIAIVMATCVGSTLWGQQNDSLLKNNPKIAKIVPRSPAPKTFVADIAGVLSAQEHDVIDAKVRQLQDEGLGHVGVAILPSIDDQAPSDVALAIYRTWRIGHIAPIGSVQRNLGVLILIVPKELAPDNKGQCFIEVGRGSQGLITDGAAGSICRLTIIPLLKNKNYSGALMAGVGAVEAKMREDPAFANRNLTSAASNIPADSVVQAKPFIPPPLQDNTNFTPIIIIFGAIVFFFGSILFFASRQRSGKCPQCHKPAFNRKRKTIAAATRHSTGVADVVGTCKACGFTKKYRETIPKKSSSDSSSSWGSSSDSSSSDSSSSSSSSDFGGSGSSDGGGGGSSY